MKYRLALLLGLLLGQCLTDLCANPSEWAALIHRLNDRSQLIHRLFGEMEKDMLHEQPGIAEKAVSVNYSSWQGALSLCEGFGLEEKSLIALQKPLQEAEERYRAFFQLREAYYLSGRHSDLLREMAICLEDLEAIHSRIYFGIQSLWKERDFPHTAEAEFLLSGMDLIREGNQLAQAIRGGLSKDIRLKHEASREAYGHWKAKSAVFHHSGEEELIQKIQAFGESWKKILSIGQQYESLGLPSRYEKQGKNYYVFNHQLMPLFADKSSGIVPLYNDILQHLKLSFPPGLLRLPWIYAPPKTRAELPTHLIVLMDQSGSMARDERFESIKALLPDLLEQMPASSRLSLIGWSDSTNIYMEASQEWGGLSEVMATIKPQGEIKDRRGLETAYGLPVIPAYEVQVLLFTDGGFPISYELLQQVEDGAYHSQRLSVGYMGGKKRKSSLRRLAGLGKGSLYDLQYHRDREALKQMIQSFVSPN